MAKLPKGRKPRVFLPWHGLIWQLFVVTILPLTALVLVITFGSLAIHQQAMRTLVGERDARAVKTAATALEEQLKQRGSVIRVLSQLADETAPVDLAQILSTSSYLLSDFDAGLAFFSKEGTLESSIGDQELWISLDRRRNTAFQSLVGANSPPGPNSNISTLQVGGKEIVLVLAISPQRQRIAAGAFSAAVLVGRTLTSAFSSEPQVSAIVLDKDYGLLYQSGTFSNNENATTHPGIAEALRGESGSTYVQVGNSEHVVSYSPIAPVGWALVFEEPWEMVANPTLRTTQLAPLVLVPVLLLALLVLWFVTRQVIRPLQLLESKATTLAWGNFQVIEEPVGGIHEIRHLQEELVHMARKVQAAQKSLHDYIGAITTAQEDERRRMARELHDDTIQALIALKQQVQLTQMELHDIPEAGSLEEISTLTEQTIENLRRLTRALRPIYLEDLGLVTALEMLVRETSQATELSVRFQRQGTERRFSPNVELALYRIAQEALNNVVRHARANDAGLSISFTAQDVTLQVSDDGKGFEVPKSPAEFAPSGHFGLLGLYERTELIGAHLVIDTSPGRGSRITVHLPV